MMADVSPEVRWTKIAGFPCAGTWVGLQRVIDNVFTVLRSTLEGYHFKLESLIDGGDRIIGTGDYRGTYRASGKSIRADSVHVVTRAREGHAFRAVRRYIVDHARDGLIDPGARSRRVARQTVKLTNSHRTRVARGRCEGRTR